MKFVACKQSIIDELELRSFDSTVQLHFELMTAPTQHLFDGRLCMANTRRLNGHSPLNALISVTKYALQDIEANHPQFQHLGVAPYGTVDDSTIRYGIRAW